MITRNGFQNYNFVSIQKIITNRKVPQTAT
jgi:hypothetical protein